MTDRFKNSYLPPGCLESDPKAPWNGGLSMANLSNKEGTYTPSPWIIREARTNSGTWLEIYVEGEYYCDGSEFCIAQTGTVKSKPHGKRWVRTREANAIEVNARLIAAAPELLEALKQARIVLGEAGSDEHVKQLTDEQLGKLWIAVTKMADTAISKAEGKS